jgi:LysR family transcriptional activator of nhaA
MEWLNYHHLLYFWTVAREGSIVRAARVLNLSHPTISAQVRALEEALGQPLFRRVGRKLVLTEMGHLVLGYADEIFATGRDMLEAVRGRPAGRRARLNVGVADGLPKLVVRRLLDPIRRLDPPVRIVARDDRPARLVSDLSQHALDVVLTDEPIDATTAVRVFHHLLGECPVAFFANRQLAARLRPRFPRSLDGAPVLLPTEGCTLRRSLDAWFDREAIRPRIVAEFDDSALLKSFGEDGWGAFPSPTVVGAALRRQYGAMMVGRIPDVQERFYAITAERRIKNPAVAAICEKARTDLFGS